MGSGVGGGNWMGWGVESVQLGKTFVINFKLIQTYGSNFRPAVYILVEDFGGGLLLLLLLQG